MPLRAVVVIGDTSDLLVGAALSALRERGVDAIHAPPPRLADLTVTLDDRGLRVEGRNIGGVLFRASPEDGFSEGFVETDRSFCDWEMRAVWLAAQHLPDVLAINRYDAGTWFEGAAWPAWRRTLVAAGIPVARLRFGGDRSPRWLPYGGRWPVAAPGIDAGRVFGAAGSDARALRTFATVAGRVFDANAPARVRRLAPWLADHGVRLAAVTVDHQDAVLAIDPAPPFPDPAVASRAADMLSHAFEAHLLDR